MEDLRYYLGEVVEKGSYVLAWAASATTMLASTMVPGTARYPCLCLGTGILLSVPVAGGIMFGGIVTKDRIQNPCLYRRKNDSEDETRESGKSTLADKFFAQL